jgi:hypothetical protein
MGLEFKLSDRELPVSPVFVHFLAQTLRGLPFDREIWAEQRSESLTPRHVDPQDVAAAAAIVMGSAVGRERLARAYTLLFSLLTGDLRPLHELQSRFHFVNIIGIPRTGGSYLTAELYRALGMVPAHVPNGLAHDSFPEAGPFQLQPGVNSWVVTLKTMAEYLTMVEVFFGDQHPHSGKIVVPKKLTKAAYAGGFFHRVLGEDTEHVLTVRHPVASCVSTYDKSGGLPADGRFTVRSNIEEWCHRDLQHTGCSAEQLSRMDYFETYLRYWEYYHSSLATTGLSANRNLKVVAFSESSLRASAQSYHDRYGSELRAAEFHISNKARRLHPEWMARAQPAIDRVAAVWKSVGVPFPAQEINHCW